MRNVTGTPAEGDDFFDRNEELDAFLRDLQNQSNILLTAPRRVGKTSFVLKLCEHWRGMSGRKSAFFNVEGCDDEIDFAERLIESLRDQGLHPDWLPGLADWFRRVKAHLKGLRVGAGVDVEVTGVPDLDHSTLGRVLESILERIDREQQEVLIAIDELPEMLLSLAQQEKGASRVGRFLHWLRSIRQTHRKQIRWLFLGSIGLDSFVETHQLSKTINDLTTRPLGAFSREVADAFLEKLGVDNGHELSAEVREAIIDRLGWPLPYHLQLVFHALVELNSHDVDAAIEHLLNPGQASVYFDTWRQRLKDQFPTDVHIMAVQVLSALCRHPRGLSRDQLLTQLMAARPQGDVTATNETLGMLLQVLQRDGYLLREQDSYAFRSFLLREYWLRRDS